ncbi:MAG: hypothetical protein SOZ34_02835 [Clostridia bacterium]|nr:hypothetical protein [Clostridia bacterium]
MKVYKKISLLILSLSLIVTYYPLWADAEMIEQGYKIYQTRYDDFKSFMKGFTEPTEFTQTVQNYVSNSTFSLKIKFDFSGEQYKEFITSSKAYITEKADSNSEPELYMMPEHVSDDSITPFNMDISVPGSRTDSTEYKTNGEYTYVFDITEDIVSKLNGGENIIAYNLFNNTANGMRITSKQSDGFRIINTYMTGTELLEAIKNNSSEDYIKKCIRFALGEKAYASYLMTNDEGRADVLEAARIVYSGYEDWKDAVSDVLYLRTGAQASLNSTDIIQLFTNGGKLNGYNGTDTWVGAVASQKIKFNTEQLINKKFIKRAYIDFSAAADADTEPVIYMAATVFENDDINAETMLEYNKTYIGKRTTDDDYINRNTYSYTVDISGDVENIAQNNNIAYNLFNPTNNGIRINRSTFVLRVEYAVGDEAVLMYRNGEISLEECISFLLGEDIGIYYSEMTDSEKARIKAYADTSYRTNDLWCEAIKTEISKINGSANAEMTTGLTGTNQDIFYIGAEGRTLNSVKLNSSVLSADKYSYNGENGRLTIDKSLFENAGEYLIEAEFIGEENRAYNLISKIQIENQYVYYNNFDGYDEAKLAQDPMGQPIGSDVTGISEIAPEWSLLPYSCRFDGEEYRKWSHNYAGKLQNRIGDYNSGDTVSKGITLDVLDMTNIRRAAAVLDLDRVFNKPVNKETLGSNQLNISFDVIFDKYENSAKPLSIALDNCIEYGSWGTSVMSIDPVWGITFNYNNKSEENYTDFQGYYADTDKYVNDGVGRNNNGIDWAVLNDGTKVDLMIDFEDISNIKLYVKLQGRSLYFKAKDGDNEIVFDYMPLNPVRNLENYYDLLEPEWMSGLFPLGYNGMTMLKFIKTDAAMQAYIDNVKLLSEVNRIKTIISEIADYPEEERAAAAGKVWVQYLRLSDADRARINNIGLLGEYNLYSVEQAAVNGNVVTAKIKATGVKPYKAVCMLYENNGVYTELIDKSITDISTPGDKVLEFDFESIPNSALIKVMLWDEFMKYPLCNYACVQVKGE